jgi:GntR family transcriptional repressor for pyruvate dehydrogenase complex
MESVFFVKTLWHHVGVAIRMYGGAAAAVFTPLDPLSRAEQVARRLTDAIVLGLIPAHHPLPGEAELGRLLGVSTVTVREALKELRAAGLVETRRGRGGGSFVLGSKEPAMRLVLQRLLRLSTAQIRDHGDQHAALAGAAARLAARRATPADLARLRRALEQLDSAESDGERRRAENHLQIEIAAVAQSPLLFREEVGMQAEMGPLLWLGPRHDAVHTATDALAAQVVAAIEGGNGDLARALTEERVAAWTAHLVELRLQHWEQEESA